MSPYDFFPFVTLLLVQSQLLLVLQEIKVQGLGAVSWTGSGSWRGEDWSVSCSALPKQLHEVLLVLLRWLYFSGAWCRWAVEAEPSLVVFVYFTLYWIYYLPVPAPFPDFLFSSLELIIVPLSAFVQLSNDNTVRETDFVNKSVDRKISWEHGRPDSHPFSN